MGAGARSGNGPGARALGARDTRRSPKAIIYQSLYKDARWYRNRAIQLSRFPNCEMCAALDPPRIRKATIVDHRKPHRGNAVLFFQGKLTSLCKPHHDSVKQKWERSGQRGKCGPDGLPVDPSHPWNS